MSSVRCKFNVLAKKKCLAVPEATDRNTVGVYSRPGASSSKISIFSESSLFV